MSVLPLLLYALLAARLTVGLPAAFDLVIAPDLFALGVAAVASSPPGASTPAPGSWRRRGLLDQLPTDSWPIAVHALVLGIGRDLAVGTPLGASALAFVIAAAALRGLWHRIRPAFVARAAIAGFTCSFAALGAEVATALDGADAPVTLVGRALPDALLLGALTAAAAAALLPGMQALGALAQRTLATDGGAHA